MVILDLLICDALRNLLARGFSRLVVWYKVKFRKNGLHGITPMKIQAASSATDVATSLPVYTSTRSRKSSSYTHRRKKSHISHNCYFRFLCLQLTGFAPLTNFVTSCKKDGFLIFCCLVPNNVIYIVLKWA